MVLADKFVLVEGPSDEILFERFYRDKNGRRPIDAGIDVISMRGLALRRCLELAQALGKGCAALRDNDGTEPVDHLLEIKDLLSETRKAFIGEVVRGATLEPQVVCANDEAKLRRILKIQPRAILATWMKNNKTEAALRLAESTEALAAPDYFTAAIEFVDGLR